MCVYLVVAVFYVCCYCCTVLVVVQCILHESAITFGTVEHSRIFLMGPEPWSNRVFSWFREEVMQARSRFTNVEKILDISSRKFF